MDETQQHHLVIVQPFADYQKGQKITDPTEIQAILGGENAFAVVKILAE